MVTLFIEEEEGAEEEVEEEENKWVRDLLRQIQPKALGEVPLENLEGEMEIILFPRPYRKKWEI